MKLGMQVIVTFLENANLDPSPGTVIEHSYCDGKVHLIRVQHDNGQGNWHLEKRVSPLLKPVK